ncbi:hypothetical protein B1H58_15085 [Pantoea alhagi]|uniref:Methyl-accepting chemotaxis protein n=2 Tax=Pantoea alhagi TaxID=1891675 RepID=A0A1W6B808_9GAMM|nr:hypothetical protein B1H58_15085 [Pantoea alhagi]
MRNIRIVTAANSLILIILIVITFFIAYVINIGISSEYIFEQSKVSSQKSLILNEIRYKIAMTRADINTLDADIWRKAPLTQRYVDSSKRRMKDIEIALKELEVFRQEQDVKEIIKFTNELVRIYSFSLQQLLNGGSATTSTSSILADLSERVNNVLQQEEEENKLYASLAHEYKNKIVIFSSAVFIVIIIISVTTWRWVRNNLLYKLHQSSLIFAEISKGNLLVPVPCEDKNEFGLLFAEMNKMKNALIAMISSVQHSAAHIEQNTNNIALGNDDLSSRTESQATSLQQTAASMEEIKITVSQNAETADQASQLTTRASQISHNAADIMSNVISTMGNIEHSANRIAFINNVINDIADQTNILALNAAVEAARAGEQGRGFAVVAAEVRNLAKRSSDAAKEINQLIAESVKNVNQGTDRVTEAGNTMKELVSSIAQVNEIMQGITLASAEQSSGVTQIAQALNDIDNVTQKNAALVEESTKITQDLSLQAAQLTEAINVFKLERGTSGLSLQHNGN